MPNVNESVVLQKIAIIGYRSCQGTVFQPHPQLSVLIGINGVGKTNILNAIRLLAPQDVRRFSSRRIPVDQSPPETIITAWFLVDGNRIGIRITLLLGQTAHNNGEVLSCSELWNFGSLTESKQWVEYPAFMVDEDRNSAHDVFQQRLFRRQEL